MSDENCQHDWGPQVQEYYGRDKFEFVCSKCYDTREATVDEESIYECGYDAGRKDERRDIAKSLTDGETMDPDRIPW